MWATDASYGSIRNRCTYFILFGVWPILNSGLGEMATKAAGSAVHGFLCILCIKCMKWTHNGMHSGNGFQCCLVLNVCPISWWEKLFLVCVGTLQPHFVKVLENCSHTMTVAGVAAALRHRVLFPYSHILPWHGA
jgi:hypothetical protein